MSAVEDGEKPEGGTMPTEPLDEIEANLQQLLTGLLFDSQKQRVIRAALEAAVAQEREACERIFLEWHRYVLPRCPDEDREIDAKEFRRRLRERAK